MNRNEHITRLAAQALGVPIESHWTWVESQDHIGFRDMANGHGSFAKNFSPLSDLATAYRMEIKLRMRVTYKRTTMGERHDMVIIVGCDDHGGGVMHTITETEDPIRARMFAATQFAALCATMGDVQERETRADLEQAHHDEAQA